MRRNPEVWDAAMFEEAVEKVRGLMGREGMIETAWNMADALREHLPECYEVLIRYLNPTGRASDMLEDRYRREEGSDD